MTNKLDELKLKTMENLFTIGSLLNEKSQDQFDVEFINERIANICEDVCLLIRICGE